MTISPTALVNYHEYLRQYPSVMEEIDEALHNPSNLVRIEDDRVIVHSAGRLERVVQLPLPGNT